MATELDRLRTALAHVFEGVERIPSAIELVDSGRRPAVALLKGIEDALDAVVFAHVPLNS